VADIISSNDFYVSEHPHIYLAIQELFATNKTIDFVTIINMLVSKGVCEKAGGQDYIRRLVEIVPSARNVKDYARIVKEKAMLRSLVEAGNEIAEAANSEQDSVESIVEFAEQRIYAIAEGRENKNFIPIRELIGNLYKNLEDLQKNGIEARGVKTNFRDLDEMMGGFGNSDMVLIGARPGMGKTSFALNIATNVAASTNKAVCIFSLEMSADQLVSRIISSEALVDSHVLRTGALTKDDHMKLAEAVSRLAGLDILVDDTPGISVTGMKAKLRRVNNLGLVIIDYLQLMQSDRRIDNRVQEVAEISRGIKIMAKELNVPIVCLSQLSRNTESRQSKKPMLSDLRDSGSIEQDADSVLFLYRKDYYKDDEKEKGKEGSKDSGSQENIAEVIIAKNRHGSTGSVEIGWIPQYTKFLPIARVEASQ
jgi:replicative DNA helicase